MPCATCRSSRIGSRSTRLINSASGAGRGGAERRSSAATIPIPDGRPEPSAQDRDSAGEAGFVWLIAALAAGGEAALAAYLFDGHAFLPLAVSDCGSLDPARGLRV